MSSILITGGTGFLGRHLAKRLLQTTTYSRIVVLSRDEHKQASIAASLKEFDQSDRLRFFIGDVRDKDRLSRAFRGVDHIVHAAALKRIEVGYYNPDEMVKTNVIGTMNVIEAAFEANVKRVVGTSSDKAWQPISAYGQSKALAETLLMSANNMSPADGPRFFTLRYGNVAGSTGSVIPRWREMIEAGADKVPVSDPDCTRFWMNIDQAVGLVLHALAHYRTDRPILPLSLSAFRLGDLAEAMGVDVDVKGLPHWEKKHEGLDFGMTSDSAPRMSVQDIKRGLVNV